MYLEYTKYLATEREISSFKIESLKRLGDNSPSTKRLLAIEEEFISIPFETMAFTISDLLSAIDMFRNSRTLFYNTYSIERKTKEIKEIDEFNLLKEITSVLTKNIASRQLTHDTKEEIPLKIIRSEGRILVILLCILKYFKKSIDHLMRLGVTLDQRDIIVEMINKYYQDIFIFYNDIIDSSNDFGFLSDQQRRIISKTKKLYIQKFDNSVDNLILSRKTKGQNILGCFLPVKHVGRETAKPYYLKIIVNEADVSKLFSQNIKVLIPPSKDEYYKFIQLVSPEEIASNLILLERYEDLLSSIPAMIDISRSFALIPSSRTEDDGIKESFEAASAIFSSLAY